MVSHDRDLLNDVCDHIVHIDQQKLVTYNGNYDRFERTRAERLEQRRRAAGQGRRPAQAHAGLRRPLQGQGQQGAPGPVAHEDDREAGADRHGAGRRADHLQLPVARACSPRRSRRSTRSRSAIGDGPLVLRKLDLRLDMDDRIALLGQNGNGKSTFIRLLSDRLEPREGRIKKTPKLRVGYFSQDQEEGLDYEATPFDHMASALGPGTRRDQGARPARPLRLLARPRRPQGRRAVGRREDAPAAVARHAQRPSPAAARRADQPSRHGCARLAGRRHQRLRRRRRAGEPRHASGEDGRRPALGGGRRHGDSRSTATSTTTRPSSCASAMAAGTAKPASGSARQKRRRRRPPLSLLPRRNSASSRPIRGPSARRSRRRWRPWRRASPSSTSSAASSRPSSPRPTTYTDPAINVAELQTREGPAGARDRPCRARVAGGAGSLRSGVPERATPAGERRRVADRRHGALADRHHQAGVDDVERRPRSRRSWRDGRRPSG